MTSRPGRIKRIVEVPEGLRASTDDVRSLPEFGRLRHEIWRLLQDEVHEAEQEERRNKLSTARPVVRSSLREAVLRG